MRRHAFLVNTSRGGLVNESDLANALRAGTIAGAAGDVVSQEPIRADNPLLSAPNCLITPHIAWSSLAARQRIMQTTAKNIAAFLARLSLVIVVDGWALVPSGYVFSNGRIGRSRFVASDGWLVGRRPRDDRS